MGVSYKKLFKLLIDRDMKKKDLRIAAGLSPASVSKLAKDEHVLTEIGRRLKHKSSPSAEVKPSGKVKPESPENEQPEELSLTETDDPRAFLTELMNADGADLRMRLEAAKTLMPYVHGKVADQGKKEQKAEAAKQVGKGRYSQGKPPLSVVKG